MGVLQRELRFVVVERLDTTPPCFAVTTVAHLAETSLVGIVRLVAVEAASRSVAELYVLRVTTDARHGFMCIPKFEIRERVIERLPVQLDDIGLAPLVIGMAMVAVLVYCLGLTPVKSFARPAVVGRFLVASEAEPTLRPACERCVTVAAILFELRVPGNDRSRHDQLFEQVLRARSRSRRGRYRDSDREHACDLRAQQRASAQKK
jgi:hypothetical protein